MPSGITIQSGYDATLTVVNPGIVNMLVSLVPNDSLDAILAQVILDSNDDPILDELGQYILGSTS